ncbi:DUF5686 and carboxypeptidase regulatory-like domain-containing protein [uncultured Flavobacterium sp.]|uniref:DUF5686 and carboxypeptidase regulatory-like domain-containing protein n=1 Tax=uncultured Flavobacterium sp. TaxID=165435 RepID=UPI0025CD80E0|nr:DUF5686 and carboxypeptidase regulatory-like domain-containing protein [uncultured Flavobacterium sp.]
MHKFITALFLLAGLTSFAQIKGKITSSNGEPIPFVSVTIENTYTGTTANEAGQYDLPFKETGNHTLIFQSIGFKAKKIPVNITSFPYLLNVTLEDESYELSEVTITKGEDPAYAIVRNAVANKKKNSEKTGRFEADFYSKGIFRVKNVPKRIMGMKVDVPEGELDSTGSGIIYLSETVSHITFQQPNSLKEKIIASKISGDNNGFSYNTAAGTFYNFYEDYVDMEDVAMISPIAKGCFGYYRYKYEGSFTDENGFEVSKIKVIPRRDKEPVFEGYIYIVDDSWALSAIDLDIKGYRIRQNILEVLTLQQNFSYNSTNGIWAKNSQTFDIKAGMFGVGFTGKMTHVYSNYVFHDTFDKGTFTKELVSFEKDSNKKDSIYWTGVRPVPLTDEERTDYVKKDSIAEVRKTTRDTTITNRNRFKVIDVLSGYDYRSKDNKTSFNYDGVLQFPKYNTVQGWNFDTRLSFSTFDMDKKRNLSLWTEMNYGIAENRFRAHGGFSTRIWKLGTYSFAGGNNISQFNAAEPISPILNTFSSLLFKENYMKLYDRTYARVGTSRWIFNGLTMAGSVEYNRRRPLFNTTDYVLIKDNKDYTSNNPLEPDNYTSSPFAKHELWKANISGSIRFGQKYITRPDGKIPVTEVNYPGISFMYEKAFSSGRKGYEYDFIAARVSYSETFDNKGTFGFNVKAGKFFNADDIAFMDYKHFNGNQTHVGTEEQYLNVFNLLPYYTHSTNDSYLETHIEHNDKGYFMNKIPLLADLQWNLVLGYHSIATPQYKPYHEFTAGFDNVGLGKFRMLRIDYVRAYQGGFVTDGVIFGLKFLDML